MKPAVSHHHCLFKTLGEETRLYSYATQTEAPAQQVLGNKIVRTRSRLFHIFSGNNGRNSPCRIYRQVLLYFSASFCARKLFVGTCFIYHTYINVYVQTHSPVILPIHSLSTLYPHITRNVPYPQSYHRATGRV